MGRKEKPMLVGKTHIPTMGELLRRFRHEYNLTLTDMSDLTHFSNSHLSNVEHGRANMSKDILIAYEKHLRFKPNEIEAFFLLLHAEIIPIDSQLADVSEVDLNNALEITSIIDYSPSLIEQVAGFIRKKGCSLSDYLELYQPQIADELRYHGRPSLVEFRLRILLEGQS